MSYFANCYALLQFHNLDLKEINDIINNNNRQNPTEEAKFKYQKLSELYPQLLKFYQNDILWLFSNKCTSFNDIYKLTKRVSTILNLEENDFNQLLKIINYHEDLINPNDLDVFENTSINENTLIIVNENNSNNYPLINNLTKIENQLNANFNIIKALSTDFNESYNLSRYADKTIIGKIVQQNIEEIKTINNSEEIDLISNDNNNFLTEIKELYPFEEKLKVLKQNENIPSLLIIETYLKFIGKVKHHFKDHYYKIYNDNTITNKQSMISLIDKQWNQTKANLEANILNYFELLILLIENKITNNKKTRRI